LERDIQPASLRNYTAADLLVPKGQRKLTQTTANTMEEAAAASDAGIDLIMGNAQNTPTFAAMKDGADSIYIARGPHIVEMLAREEISVMYHLDLVPRKSTWRGGLRAIGKTAKEALELWKAFQTMENAGAFSVEAEVIAAEVMTEISKRTKLINNSLGSGSRADIVYLFQNDICGEQPASPRHAQVFGNIHALREQIKAERRLALTEFRTTVEDKQYPGPNNQVSMDDHEKERFFKLSEVIPALIPKGRQHVQPHFGPIAPGDAERSLVAIKLAKTVFNNGGKLSAVSVLEVPPAYVADYFTDADAKKVRAREETLIRSELDAIAETEIHVVQGHPS